MRPGSYGGEIGGSAALFDGGLAAWLSGVSMGLISRHFSRQFRRCPVELTPGLGRAELLKSSANDSLGFFLLELE